MKENRARKFETLCVHAGVEPEPVTGAIMTPIFQTTTYVQDSPGNAKIYDYTRAGNPTRTALETSLASLENAAHAISFASGLAAVNAVAQLLAPGDHVLVCDDVYGGTGRLFRKVFTSYGIEFQFIDMTDLNTVQANIRKNTKMLWIETPTNPLLKIIDISAMTMIAHAHDILLAVDNTFASPIFQNPLEQGADLVVHSTTKYIGGHSDVLGGCIMVNREDLSQRLKFLQFACGSVNAPYEAFLLLRSIKTLALRMKKHHENAMQIAKELQGMSFFKEVIFPGLPSHPHHDLAAQQMRGFAGMITVRVNADFSLIQDFLSRLELFSLAESLGGVESLVNHPVTMTHASVPEDHRYRLGITPDLLRFSVGIEDAEDLIEDIRKASKS